MGLAVAVGLTIIFVKAGSKSGQSGGQQSADILTSFGKSSADIINAATGG